MKDNIPPHIKDLLERYLDKTLTPAEAEQLDQWLHAHGGDDIKIAVPIDRESLQNRMKSRLNRAIEEDLQVKEIRRPVARTALRWTGVLLFLATIGYFLYLQIDNDIDTEDGSPHYSAMADVPSPVNNAYLIRGNNDRLDLSELDDELVFSPEGVLSFQQEVAQSNSPLEEVIEQLQIVVPRGNLYEVILPDGSKVSLNANSRLNFPSQFVGSERSVVLSGEGFFDVNADPTSPFVVQTSRQIVKVTGTRFNVSAYEEDAAESTALLEGKVAMQNRSDGSWTPLDPGQAGFIGDQGVHVKNYESLDHLISWKSNIFVFEQESISSILKKVSRWYDVQFEWKDKSESNILLNGKIRKEAGLKEVLTMLSLAAKVEFFQEGTTLIVENQKNTRIN